MRDGGCSRACRGGGHAGLTPAAAPHHLPATALGVPANAPGGTAAARAGCSAQEAGVSNDAEAWGVGVRGALEPGWQGMDVRCGRQPMGAAFRVRRGQSARPRWPHAARTQPGLTAGERAPDGCARDGRPRAPQRARQVGGSRQALAGGPPAAPAACVHMRLPFPSPAGAGSMREHTASGRLESFGARESSGMEEMEKGGGSAILERDGSMGVRQVSTGSVACWVPRNAC